jgi:acyl carrier protein
MNRDDAERLIREKLSEIAPETADLPMERDSSFRDQFDLDSMDFLNLLSALHEATGLPFPESEYPRLATPGGCIDYLTR